MNTLKIKDIVFGEGKPKLCIPIFGKTEEEILLQARNVCTFRKAISEEEGEEKGLADLVEWRADMYEAAKDEKKVLTVLSKLRRILGATLLLFTFRTENEGGEQDITQKEYENLNKAVIASETVDLIDIEAFMNEAQTIRLTEYAHERGVAVVGSNHHFSDTPSKEEMTELLKRIQNLGVDLPKLAVMPEDKRDLLALLEATLEMSEKYAKKPIITMSMGSDGMISRLTGEVFGSAVTFGAINKASAPGQIEAEALEEVLSIIHKNI